MLHLNTVEKSIKIIVVVMILIATSVFSYDLFAMERGSKKRMKSGISSSVRLSTTTEIVNRVTIQKNYVNRELVAIQEETAQGRGAHLNALAKLLKISDLETFNHWMQSNYQILFDDLNHPEDLLDRVKKLY